MARKKSEEAPEAQVESDEVEAEGHEVEETLGSWLARERALRDISIEEIAEVTKVGRPTLRAIEADDHDRLPAPPFVRGFLRAYAQHVGLDVDQVLLRYSEMTGASGGTVQREGGTELDSEDDPGDLQARRSRTVLVGAVLVVVLVAAAALAYVFLASP